MNYRMFIFGHDKNVHVVQVEQDVNMDTIYAHLQVLGVPYKGYEKYDNSWIVMQGVSYQSVMIRRALKQSTNVIIHDEEYKFIDQLESLIRKKDNEYVT